MFFNISSEIHEFPFRVTFRIKKTYADTATGMSEGDDEEFLVLKLVDSYMDVEVCSVFFSVSVDTVPQIHINKQ